MGEEGVPGRAPGCTPDLPLRPPETYALRRSPPPPQVLKCRNLPLGAWQDALSPLKDSAHREGWENSVLQRCGHGP